jgi:hypothetical protein
VIDADALLSASRRPLVLGIGGGGDVVGALATAEACRAHGAQPVVGGVTWERRPIDPAPGPRAEAEIEGARRLAPGVIAATGSTRVRESGVVFAESRMAELLGGETVLVDATLGPAALADGIAAAAGELAADLIVFVDVGGDALAHGDEPGLASPLCDALMLAAAAHLAKRSVCPSGGHPAGDDAVPVLGGIFGVGCDGELSPAEVLERLAEVAAAGGFAGARGLTAPIADRLDQAVEAIPTEASAQALRCFRGENRYGDNPPGAPHRRALADRGAHVLLRRRQGDLVRRPARGHGDRRGEPGSRERAPARPGHPHRARLRA